MTMSTSSAVKDNHLPLNNNNNNNSLSTKPSKENPWWENTLSCYDQS